MTRFSLCLSVAAISLCQVFVAHPTAATEPDLQTLLREFKDYSGADLVFQREDLPVGRYHDVLKPLSDSRKATAAAICVKEARMYPPKFFRDVGLKSVGVFDACVSKTTTDPARRYDSQLGGYRYFGVYNRANAIAAAFETDGQLALTFHHEIFHHVDSTVDGETDSWQLSSDDAFFLAAISGRKPYTAPPIADDDLAALRKRCIGFTLQDAVSEYAAKNSREDQAETARHLMSMLPSSLVQAIEKPELAGSQRILHVLREYEKAVPDGPGFDWFVDVALDRARRETEPESVDQLLVRLKAYADGGRSGFAGATNDPQGVRAALKAVVRIKPADASEQQSAELVQLATKITGALLQQRIRPDSKGQRFDIWGQEDSNGVNHTLRRDVTQIGNDAKRLKLIAMIHQRETDPSADPLTQAHLRNLRMVACYYVFIKSNWSVSPGTQQVFESAQQTILNSLPAESASLALKLQTTDLAELAKQIPQDGRQQ